MTSSHRIMCLRHPLTGASTKRHRRHRFYLHRESQSNVSMAINGHIQTIAAGRRKLLYTYDFESAPRGAAPLRASKQTQQEGQDVVAWRLYSNREEFPLGNQWVGSYSLRCRQQMAQTSFILFVAAAHLGAPKLLHKTSSSRRRRRRRVARVTRTK